MKKHNNNRQGFKNHVDTIRHIEADKDEFLNAARLERHESRTQPFTAKDKIKLAAIGGAGVVLTAILVLGYLSGNFVPALIGVGVITFIGIMMIAAGS